MHHVAVTTTSYPPAIGGAQIHAHEIAKQVANRGIQVDVVTAWTENRTDWILGTTLKAPSRGGDYRLDGIHVHQPGLTTAERWKMAPGAALYYFLPELASPYMAIGWKARLRVLPASTELIHNVRIGREHITEASLMLARERGIPFVLTPNHSPRMNRLVSRHLFALYRKSDLLFAFTEVERQQLLDLGVPATHVAVIGVGPVLAQHSDPEAFRHRYGITGRMVLFLGQKYQYKGFETLLAAAPIVWSRFPDTTFVFIGPNYGEAETILGATNDRRIVNIGGLAPFSEEKASALAACDVFCLPSRQEGFGGVFVEAWTFRKPVIGGDIPPLREIIRDGVDGFLVTQDPSLLAERVITLLGEPGLANALGEAGWRKTQERFRWEKIADTVLRGYEQAKTNYRSKRQK
ncbi:MAG: glycosyltransferase family 4 protein [Symbiobacteriia bacterium]